MTTVLIYLSHAFEIDEISFCPMSFGHTSAALTLSTTVRYSTQAMANDRSLNYGAQTAERGET